MSEKSSEMREAVATVAGPRAFHETRESWLARAARNAGISFRQAKSLFYGEITDPEHKAARRMLAAAERQGKREASDLADKFESIARSMNAADQDFYSADVAALIDAARALRGLARTRTDGDER